MTSRENDLFRLFDKSGQVLSDQTDGRNENIRSNWIKTNEEANSSKRERIQNCIDGQKYKSNNSIQDFKIVSRYLAEIECRKQGNWTDTFWWNWHVRCFFMTACKQNGGEPSDLSLMYVKKHSGYFDEQRSQRNILNDNEFKQCR